MPAINHARLRVSYAPDVIKALRELAGCLNQAAYEKEVLLHCVALGYCVPGESMHSLFVRDVRGNSKGIEASIYSKTSGASYHLEADHGALPCYLVQAFPGWLPTSYSIQPS